MLYDTMEEAAALFVKVRHMTASEKACLEQGKPRVFSKQIER
jgi:hypothetical protein